MRRRDLDAWAVALGVTNDDDAITRLAALFVSARMIEEEYAAICDRLRGVDARGYAARAADHMHGASDALYEVKRSFLLHERGQ